MPNEPVDPVGGLPPSQPTIPTVADLISPKVRAWTYALLAPANAALIPLTLNVAGSAQVAITSALAFVNALGFGVALSNVPRRI